MGLEIRRDRAAGLPTDLDGFWEREGDIPRDIGYVNALSHLSLVAVQLEDRARAERLYDLLSPYALLNTPNSMLFYDWERGRSSRASDTSTPASSRSAVAARAPRTEADRAAKLAAELGMGWLAAGAGELVNRC